MSSTKQITVKNTGVDSEFEFNKTKIGEILKNPEEYNDKTVIIAGQYGGWRYNGCDLEKTAMKTINDSMIYDETGCLYMSDVEILSDQEYLSPYDEKMINQELTIKAKVELINGKIILTKPTRFTKVAKLPAYYEKLAQKCLEIENPDCCIESIEIMASGNYKIAADDGNCPPGFNVDQLKCPSSFKWCVPNYYK